MLQLVITNENNFQRLLCVFSSLSFLPITFIFLLAYHLLINAWSSKLIRPITTIFCVPCTTMWKHFVSSSWMNVLDFIFSLVHILNLPTLTTLIPFHLPYMPFVDCAHLFVDYVNSCFDYGNTSIDYIDFSIDCVNKSNDYANTSTNSVNTFDRSSSNLYIPIWSLL